MYDIFGDLVNNPDFGKRYRSDYGFRSLVDRYKNTVFAKDRTLATLMPKIKTHTNSGGALSYSYEPLGREVRFTSLKDALLAAETNRGLKSTRLYRSSARGTHFSGGATADLARQLAAAAGPGHTARMRTWTSERTGDIIDIKRQMTDDTGKILYGLPTFGSDGSFQLLDILDPKGGRLTFQETLELAKATMTSKGSATKRAKVVSNDMRLSISSSLDDKLKVYKFDPQKVISSNPILKKRTEALARQAFNNRSNLSQTYEEILSGMYQGMVDGMSMQGMGSFEAEMAKNIAKGRALLAEAEKIKPSDPSSKAYKEYLQMRDNGNAIIREAIHQRRSVKKRGGIFNERILTAEDQSGKVFNFGKGNLHIQRQQKMLEDLIRANGDDPAKYNLDSFSAFISMFDEKTNDFTWGLSSFKSLDPHLGTRQANSDILSLLSYPEIFTNPETLVRNADQEIAKHIKDLKEGKITPALRELLDEIKTYAPSDSEGLAAAQAAERGKTFVRSLEKMINSGQDISTNDMLTSQLYSTIKGHYSRYRKGKFGQKFQVEGREFASYKMSLPMKDSLRGEIVPIILGSEDNIPMEGFIHNEGFGLTVSGPTWEAIRHAHGGADADDQLVAQLLYDEKAKRLISFNYRNPVQRGEYSILDADISMDTHAPPEIRRMYREQKDLINQLKRTRTSKTGQVKQEWITRLDEIRNTLHRYYSGEEVSILGRNGEVKILDKTTVRKIDLVGLTTARGGRVAELPAPIGFKSLKGKNQQFRSGGFYRSFQTSREISGSATSLSSIQKIIRKESTKNTTASISGQLFQFMGPEYDEFQTSSGWFKRNPALEAARTAKAAAPVPATDAEKIARALLEDKTKGLLGRWTNMDTMFRSWIATNAKSLTDEQYKQLDAILKKNQFDIVHAEDVIDTVKKTGDTAILDEIVKILDATAANFGRVVGEFQNIAQAPWHAPLRVPLTGGVDPIGYDQRMASIDDRTQFRKAYFEARGLTDDGRSTPFLAGTAEETSLYSHYFKALDQLSHRLDETDMVTEPRENLLRKLNELTYSPQEISRASTLLDVHKSAQKEWNLIMDKATPEETFAALEEMLSTGSRIDDPNSALLRAMYEMGIEDPGRQLLAMAKVSTETAIANGTPGSALGFLTRGLEDDDVTHVEDMYYEAIQRDIDGPKALKAISEIEDVKGLSEFISKEGHFTPRALSIFDPIERDKALMAKMGELTQGNRSRGRSLAGRVETVLQDMSDSGQIEDMSGFESYSDSVRTFFSGQLSTTPHNVPRPVAFPGYDLEGTVPAHGISVPDLPTFNSSYRPRTIASVSGNDGSKRFFRREAADAVADTTVKTRPLRTMMERISFDSEAVKGLIKEPLFRKGMIGLAALAGFGVINRLAKDPSADDVQGPPLLPGGSPYEDYADVNPVDMNSIYSSTGSQGQGMLYQIQMSGNFNANDFSKQISGVTGTPVSGNIYKARKTTNNRLSSRDKLSELMG